MSSPQATPRHAKTLERVCDPAFPGEHLAIWGLSGVGEGLEATLTDLLAARESRGNRVPVVSLLMRSREDAEWIERACAWLSLRGRRVIVRTRVVMPKSCVKAIAAAREQGAGACVELELAHHKPSIQRALLGAQADAAAALLLQAQHLETLEIPVVARLAPLLPGIHDQANGFGPLLRNVEAADVHHVVIEVGRLHAQQLRNLVGVQRELSVAGMLELARAYAVDPMILLGGAELPEADVEQVFKLKSRRAQALEHGFEKLASDAGLKLPACGCRAHCELAGPAGRAANDFERGYESVMGRDLFAGLEVG